MKLSYTVSREEYLSALLYLLRRRGRAPWRRFTAFMLTAGQLLFVLAFCLSEALPRERAVFLLLLSGAVLALNACLYLPTRQRARLLLRRMKRSGQWDPEYEKTHRLSWQEDKLALRYGRTERKLAAASVSQLVRLGEVLLVMTGEALFCVIPLSAWGGEEAGLAAFRAEVRERKFRESKQRVRAKREELAARGSAPYRYSYTKERYLADLKRAHRSAYAGRAGWTLPAVLRAAGGGLLLAAALLQPAAWGWRTLALLAALVLLYPYLWTFSFLLGGRLARETEAIVSFAPGREAEFYETESSLVFLGEVHCLEIPREDVLAVRRIRGGAALYLKNRMIVPVPDGGSGARAGGVQALLR